MTHGVEDFGRNGSARYVGAFPGRDLRCAEERGQLVDPGRECLMCGRQLFPGRVLIMYIELLCYDNPA